MGSPKKLGSISRKKAPYVPASIKLRGKIAYMRGFHFARLDSVISSASVTVSRITATKCLPSFDQLRAKSGLRSAQIVYRRWFHYVDLLYPAKVRPYSSTPPANSLAPLRAACAITSGNASRMLYHQSGLARSDQVDDHAWRRPIESVAHDSVDVRRGSGHLADEAQGITHITEHKAACEVGLRSGRLGITAIDSR